MEVIYFVVTYYAGKEIIRGQRSLSCRGRSEIYILSVDSLHQRDFVTHTAPSFLKRQVGVYCSLSQLLEHGFYHADPHPGNLLRTSDGKLAYLGMLMVEPLSTIGGMGCNMCVWVGVGFNPGTFMMYYNIALLMLIAAYSFVY